MYSLRSNLRGIHVTMHSTCHLFIYLATLWPLSSSLVHSFRCSSLYNPASKTYARLPRLSISRFPLTAHAHHRNYDGIGNDCRFETNEQQKISSLSLTRQDVSRRYAFKTIEYLSKVVTITSLMPIEIQASEEQSSTEGSLDITDNKRILSGTVTLQPGTQIASSSDSESPSPPTPALYITARPNKADNVPKAILDGSRGKPPPVLIARFPLPLDLASQFPFDFVLTEKDLTVEGESKWFLSTQEDLIVSARLDMDGVAATRDPDDLVGRGLYLGNTDSNSGGVIVQLQGRGFGGKFVTKKAK